MTNEDSPADGAQTWHEKLSLPLEAIKVAWETLPDGHCFFVPCIDTIRAQKIVQPMGYEVGKKPPVVREGIYRGRWGLLCSRSRSIRLYETEKQDWF